MSEHKKYLTEQVCFLSTLKRVNSIIYAEMLV